MTATEAAAVSIIYSIPVSMWIYKGMKARDMKKVFTDTACTTGVVMVMVGFVMMFARVLTLEKFPQTVLEVFMGISDNKYVILLMVNIFMVIIGMIMDDTSGTILITPILMPLLENIGVSPYQFAAIIGVNMGMGNITPPSAPFLYLGARIFRVDATDMMKPILQIILMAYVPTLILVTWIPDLSLFLPRLLMGDKLGI
jgi:tripartite ATP-independent transporter DctM subunit